jgi:pimeloyl-ACP methyl ester carboxylesterase
MAPPDLTQLTFADLLERARSGDAQRYWSPTVEATLRTSFKDGPDGRIQPSLRRDDHLEILHALWEQHPSQLFPQITVPTLIVPARRPNPTGRAAEMAPVRAQLVANAAEALPNGRLLWMEDTVHDIPLQRPAELAEAIETVATSR